MNQTEKIDDLHLTIKSNKTVYEIREPINIELKLKNIGKEDLKINTNFILHTDLRCYFKSMATGKDLFWLPPQYPAEVNEKSFVSLIPNKSITHRIGYLERYLSVSQFGHLEPGRYIIKFEYIGITEDVETKELYDGWEGTVASNSIEIKVSTIS